MIRPVFTEFALFITPFVLYGLFLWATQEGVLDLNAWSLPRLMWLSICALVLVILSFVFLSQFGGAINQSIRYGLSLSLLIQAVTKSENGVKRNKVLIVQNLAHLVSNALPDLSACRIIRIWSRQHINKRALGQIGIAGRGSRQLSNRSAPGLE